MIKRLKRIVAGASRLADLKSYLDSSDANSEAESNKIFCKPGQYMNPSYGAALESREDAKIVVFALPKSGNVWLVSMLADYVSLNGIDPMVDRLKKGVGMCHLPYSNDMQYRPDFLHAVYLLRDLRDVIVSYYHNVQTKSFKDSCPNFHYDTLEDFYFDWFLPRVVPFHKVATHAAEFAERGVPVIRYERLYDDPKGELTRLIKRLGLPLHHEFVDRAVASNAFDELQQKGSQLDVYVPPTHFRKGGYGHYRKELPSKLLAHINKEFGPMLARWGYDV